MDISKIEGLTEEQQAAITAQFNASTEGLRNKNAELLSEKKEIQGSIAEQQQIAEDARLAAIKANEDALKAAGDVEGLKSHYEAQLAEQTASANESAKLANEALLSRDKGAVLNSALGLIHDDYKELASAQLAGMIKVVYNEDKQPVTTFESGGKVVANNLQEFEGWAKEQPAFKRILNGVDSSGAGTVQARASGSTSKPYSELSLSERAKLNNN